MHVLRQLRSKKPSLHNSASHRDHSTGDLLLRLLQQRTAQIESKNEVPHHV